MTQFLFNGFLKYFSNLASSECPKLKEIYKIQRNYQAVDQNDVGTQNIPERLRSCDQKRRENKTGNPANNIGYFKFESARSA